MKIYHQDHWITIFHMATWKDLTKGIEENKYIDWISHVGRIVKRVLPISLRRSGHGYVKFISVHQTHEGHGAH